ncbi:MAG: hypothetical protein HPY55_03305 [Firmicutes bacterium]|nr:hypothetical protein [Bacillota bacterium]
MNTAGFLQPAMLPGLITVGLLVVGFVMYERSTASPVMIAVVASLAALASAGRVAFASIPNVQPTTFIVTTAGMVLGPANGFMVGALSAIASNVFLGQGPWTVWQAAAWGAVGASAGLFGVLGPRSGRWHVAVFTGVWGFLFGLIMNVWHWLSFTFPLTLRTLLVVEAAGLWFDTLHSAGNIAFSLIFGDQMLRILRRFARRLTYLTAVVLAVAVAIAAVAQLPGPRYVARAEAVSTAVDGVIERGIRYLRSTQNADGGFPGVAGGQSSEMVTSWVILAIRAVGLDPEAPEWRKGDRSPAGLLVASDEFLNNSGAASTDIARRILALLAAGYAMRGPSGLVSDAGMGADTGAGVLDRLARSLAARQRASGQFAGDGEEELLNAHFWSVLALAPFPGGIRDRAGALRFLQKNQNADGGFGFALGLPSDPDDTAAAIQAMVALGETGESLARAVGYLRSAVGSDGGVVWEGNKPNVASGSWVLQGFSAARSRPGGVPAAERRAVAEWICHLQRGDGSFPYMDGSDSMTVWMTAQAVLGLSGLAFPVAAGFSDMPASHWAAAHVNRLARTGALTGYPDGTFKPQKGVTRAEFASMAARVAHGDGPAAGTEGGGPAGTPHGAEPEYRDVPRSHWAFAAVSLAHRLNLVKGISPGVFAPGDAVTGAQVVTVACRLAGVEPAPAGPGRPWYEPYVAAGAEMGFLYLGFNASTAATRAECAYSLAAALARQ